ncbi:MAG TPA: DNA repair protein RecN [Bryobacteraceae bacterium]|jgi:DNA repair protein RecN (Recombination protein N)
MLLELAIENYAVADRLRLRFHGGLNLLTGETGSGKSIVVDALALLFGARASGDVVRSGEERARISGRFAIPTSESLTVILQGAGLETEDGELLVEREILSNGKSRAYAGSRPVTLALLKDLAPMLGDIHGQHDQQLLFSPAAQLQMLDGFAGTRELAARVRTQFRELSAIQSEIASLQTNEQEKLQRLDLWQFQRTEIESVAPVVGEDTSLEEERRIQQNVGRVSEAAGAAFEALYESPESALALIRLAMKKLDDLTRIDSSLSQVSQMLDPAKITIQEVSYTLRDYLSKLEDNPARLEEIETRLAALDRLKRKYGGTLLEVLAFLEEVRSSIAGIENADERAAALEAERVKATAEFERLSARLSADRKRAAATLSRRVEEELKPLAMERTVFEVSVSPADWSERGADGVEFLVSPNVGETPRPLEKVASGGELSRIALALKTCLVESARGGALDGSRTLVFDEVDAGISGRAAEGVGRRLKKLAAANQVLCVTHLAQIACFADSHYVVQKKESGGRTVARVDEVTGEGRKREIGRLLSGEQLTPEALKNAEQLLKAATV